MAPLEPPPEAGALPQAYLHPTSRDRAECALEARELPVYLLAKSYFDVHEYDRASFVLKDCKSAKARFLHLYAKYIAGEKRKDEDSEMVLGPLDGAVTGNKELQGIITKLEGYFSEKEDWGEEDSWLLFLYGIALFKHKNEHDARGALIRSVNLYPYNWSAWQELGATIGNLSDVGELLPSRMSVC